MNSSVVVGGITVNENDVRNAKEITLEGLVSFCFLYGFLTDGGVPVLRGLVLLAPEVSNPRLLVLASQIGDAYSSGLTQLNVSVGLSELDAIGFDARFAEFADKAAAPFSGLAMHFAAVLEAQGQPIPELTVPVGLFRRFVAEVSR